MHRCKRGLIVLKRVCMDRETPLMSLNSLMVSQVFGATDAQMKKRFLRTEAFVYALVNTP